MLTQKPKKKQKKNTHFNSDNTVIKKLKSKM